jgi:hypothetical protein
VVKRIHGNGEVDYDDLQYERPSRLTPRGASAWYLGSIVHREWGPGVLRPDGWQEWFRMHRRHRWGGRPAVILPDGTRNWYLDGVKAP